MTMVDRAKTVFTLKTAVNAKTPGGKDAKDGKMKRRAQS
jgi:hypothetical protein